MAGKPVQDETYQGPQDEKAGQRTGCTYWYEVQEPGQRMLRSRMPKVPAAAMSWLSVREEMKSPMAIIDTSQKEEGQYRCIVLGQISGAGASDDKGTEAGNGHGDSQNSDHGKKFSHNNAPYGHREVRSSWSVRALCSSDMLRMVSMGTAIISIIRVGVRRV